MESHSVFLLKRFSNTHPPTDSPTLWDDNCCFTATECTWWVRVALKTEMLPKLCTECHQRIHCCTGMAVCTPSELFTYN